MVVKVLDQFKAGFCSESGALVDGFSEFKLTGLEKYLSPSRIKKLNLSAKHYYWRYILGREDKDTPAKAFGRIMHKALLEPEEFKKNYTLQPQFSGTGSRARKAEWLANLPDDAIVLKEEEADKIIDMIDAIYHHESASKIMKDGTPEVHTYYTDPEFVDHEGNPIVWYGIMDFIRSEHWLVDVKSTECARQWLYERRRADFGYNIQMFLYDRWYTGITGVKPKIVEIAVEKGAPYCVETYEPDTMSMDHAYCQVRDAIDLLNKCMVTGKWPSYFGSEKIIPVGLPDYVYYQYGEKE